MTRALSKSPGASGRIAVILAGGRSRRMGGRDKAAVRIGGKRLIDRVLDRLTPQADRILISGSRDYGTGLTAVADVRNAPGGPAGGIYSVHQWLLSHDPDVSGFVTAPVDCPFLPPDLIERLAGEGGAAVASDGESDHPTLSYWPLEALSAAWPRLEGRKSVSLKALADLCAACRVIWRDTDIFLNVNSLEDLEAAAAVDRVGRAG